ncbi:uncharacterized protein LOC121375788 [Gigantopelta aegis]|uniref:uncharacterized protein LOC121375788 n=1 Tax=Gigantopelta aegis TaxID=1735272 RepID=UPI001B889F67|nr:uncharacterized protein LOC121375788 [Gigantopelta aegis]
MSVLDLPSRKLFIKDLARARPHVGDQSSCSKIPVWRVTAAGATRTFSCVWIQGTVVQELSAGDVLFVDDGTAIVEVTGCNKIPPSCPKVKPGQYVMIIGLLVSADTPTVRAIKIQDLSTSVSAETMWSLEVVDQSFMCK